MIGVTAALGGSCHSPVASLGEIRYGKVFLRVQILSEDGRDQLRDEAMFECDDHESPARLALALLEKAPDSIRSLFRAG